MNNSTHYRKLATQLFLLIYLAGFGFGGSLVWCDEAEAISHFEYKHEGKCLGADGGELLGAANHALVILVAGPPTACMDIPVTVSHLSSLRAQTPQPTLDICARSILSKNTTNLFAARPRWLNSVVPPPPLQALAALQTTVLII